MGNFISNPFQSIQDNVDSISMYRMVSASLSVLVVISIGFGFAGVLPYSGLSLIFSLALALTVALILNVTFAALLRITANHESAVITALILFFIILPEQNIFDTWPLVVAVTVAIASKYIITYKKQHLVNPAAMGATVLGLSGLSTTSWWVGNPSLFIPLLILGTLTVMRVRKWIPFIALIATSFIIYYAQSTAYGDTLPTALRTFTMSWPTLFLGFYMLTEPFTLPAKKDAQFFYGGLVGFLSNAALVTVIAPVTPELALVIANLAVIPTRLLQKLHLSFIEKRMIAQDTYEFVFEKPRGLRFEAGQYMEWMLPHQPADHKGRRRYFTIAASPTEDTLRIAMKISDVPSSYKAALHAIDLNEVLIASQLAGDFVLPKQTNKKLGFIAGGIGVTPFRSHLKYMLDTGNYFDTVLYYGNNAIAEMAYHDLFTQATATFPFELVSVIAKEEVGAPYEKGYISAEIIKRRSPDYLERTWYISGPSNMVATCRRELQTLGVRNKNIKTDYFSGA